MTMRKLLVTSVQYKRDPLSLSLSFLKKKAKKKHEILFHPFASFVVGASIVFFYFFLQKSKLPEFKNLARYYQ